MVTHNLAALTQEAKQAEALQEIGKSAYESIAEMVAALECDYDRLEELKEDRSELDAGYYRAVQARVEGDDLAEKHRALSEWDEENGEELAELIEAAGESESQDDAAQRIQEDPLSVEIRSDWVTPGEPMDAAEFVILLGTGGPATRIRGELNQYKEPDRAWLEVQDWGTPWTRYFDADQDTLLTYARQFYFRE